MSLFSLLSRKTFVKRGQVRKPLTDCTPNHRNTLICSKFNHFCNLASVEHLLLLALQAQVVFKRGIQRYENSFCFFAIDQNCKVRQALFEVFAESVKTLVCLLDVCWVFGSDQTLSL
ncbi:hypothetical protein D9M72_568490 [compost metagenome]